MVATLPFCAESNLWCTPVGCGSKIIFYEYFLELLFYFHQTMQSASCKRLLLVRWHEKFLLLSIMLSLLFFFLCNDEGGCTIPGRFGGGDLSLAAAPFSGILTRKASQVIRRLQDVSLRSAGSAGMEVLYFSHCSVRQGWATALQK